MQDICINWGFCLPHEKVQAIWARPRLDAKTFAFLVLQAEGFEHPEYELEWMRRLSRRFIERFGTSEIVIE